MSDAALRARVEQMVDMLNRGQLLECMQAFYAPDVRVFENDFPFAESMSEAVDRQRPFVDGCSRIDGDVHLAYLDLGRGISVLENRTKYDHPENGPGQVAGLHVLYWHDEMITREEYFSGTKADEARSFWDLVNRAGTR